MGNIIPLEFSDPQIRIMKQTVASGVSDPEFFFFLEVCKARGLNPFNREIYAIPRGKTMTIQVSIDGLRILAERSGKYRGQVGPQFCAADGVWRDEWLSDEPPVAARVGVLRSDFDTPVWAVARYKAYVQANNPLWRSMPEVMLQKCAESLALRKAFPASMAGLYTHEEMQQADNSQMQIKAPATSVLIKKGQAAGLWNDIEGYYQFATNVLDRTISKEQAGTTSAERMRIDLAIEKAIEEFHPAVQSQVEEDLISIDQLSAELSAQVVEAEPA